VARPEGSRPGRIEMERESAGSFLFARFANVFGRQM